MRLKPTKKFLKELETRQENLRGGLRQYPGNRDLYNALYVNRQRIEATELALICTQSGNGNGKV